MIIEYERARDYIRAKRDFYGAETPIGHRCSNLMEILENHSGATGTHKAALEEMMERQMRDLEKLCAARRREGEMGPTSPYVPA